MMMLVLDPVGVVVFVVLVFVIVTSVFVRGSCSRVRQAIVYHGYMVLNRLEPKYMG